jgi:hypothetical protein
MLLDVFLGLAALADRKWHSLFDHCAWTWDAPMAILTQCGSGRGLALSVSLHQDLNKNHQMRDEMTMFMECASSGDRALTQHGFPLTRINSIIAKLEGRGILTTESV